MKRIHETNWDCIAGGFGPMLHAAPSLPVERPALTAHEPVTMAAEYTLPVNPKSLDKPIPFEPEQPIRGV